MNSTHGVHLSFMSALKKCEKLTQSQTLVCHMQVLGQLPLEGQESAVSWLCVDKDPVMYEDISWEILECQPQPQQGQLGRFILVSGNNYILLSDECTGCKREIVNYSSEGRTALPSDN